MLSKDNTALAKRVNQQISNKMTDRIKELAKQTGLPISQSMELIKIVQEGMSNGLTPVQIAAKIDERFYKPKLEVLEVPKDYIEYS